MNNEKGSYGSVNGRAYFFNNQASYLSKPSVNYSDLSLNIFKEGNGTASINPIHHSTSSPKSLEQLLSPLLANSSNDPIDQIWEDKLKIARFKISSLVSALSLRENIKERNIYGIDEDICKIHTQQFALATSPSFDKYSINLDQIGLEKSVCSLEHEKRSEVVNCWKDIITMRKDLVEAINEYLSLKRKMDLLGIKTGRDSND